MLALVVTNTISSSSKEASREIQTGVIEVIQDILVRVKNVVPLPREEEDLSTAHQLLAK